MGWNDPLEILGDSDPPDGFKLSADLVQPGLDAEDSEREDGPEDSKNGQQNDQAHPKDCNDSSGGLGRSPARERHGSTIPQGREKIKASGVVRRNACAGDLDGALVEPRLADHRD